MLADDRWLGRHGIGRFADEVFGRLRSVRFLYNLREVFHPLDFWLTGRAVRKAKPDVFFSPGFNALADAGVPTVFTIHDLIHLDVPAEGSFLKRLYYEKLVRKAGDRAAKVVTVSEFSKRRILEWSGWDDDKVVVVHNGVSGVFMESGEKHKPGYAYFLYVGSHKPHKNLERTIEAFSESGLARDFKFLVNGEATDGERRVIRTRELGEAVEYFETLDDQELARYYRGAKALVMPSLYEGFGLPAVEAMACGTPVLVSRGGALEEVTDGAGVLVDAEDVKAIAEGMVKLAEDEGLCKDLRNRGMQVAGRYDWGHTAEVIDRVLHEAAGVRY